MKKLRRVCALMIATAMFASAVSCQKEVTAEDLMENVSEGNASEVIIDDVFCNHYSASAFQLLKSAYSLEGPSVVISPLATYFNMAMLANGASNKKLSNFENILDRNIPYDSMNNYMHTYYETLNNTENAKLYFNNAIWFNADKNVKPGDEFLSAAKTYFNASAYKESFNNDTVTNINNWSSNNTEMYAEYIIDSVPTDAPAFIVNNTVIEADWEAPISPENVVDGHFTNISGEEENVQMMSSYEHLYFENDSFEGFIKKYSGGNYNFMAIVPKKEGQVGMEIVLDFLSKGDGYHKTVKNSKEYVVDASIPKFSLQSQGGMKSNLTQMNFGRSFSPTDARLDLLGTCDENLYIDDLYVYTGVTVTERGTSKGSGAIVRDSSVATNVIPVALDRPFIFAIVDNNRYLPIILGVVNSVNE